MHNRKEVRQIFCIVPHSLCQVSLRTLSQIIPDGIASDQNGDLYVWHQPEQLFVILLCHESSGRQITCFSLSRIVKIHGHDRNLI